MKDVDNDIRDDDVSEKLRITVDLTLLKVDDFKRSLQRGWEKEGENK